MRTLRHHAPAAFRCTTKWVPVDTWTAPDTGALRDAVLALRARIQPGERWRITDRAAVSVVAPEETLSVLGTQPEVA